MHEESGAGDDGHQMGFALFLVQTQVFHVQTDDAEAGEVVENGHGGRLVGDVDVNLGSVDDDRGSTQLIERLGEGGCRLFGIGRCRGRSQDGNDLEFIGTGLMDDPWRPGDFAEHRILRRPAGDSGVEEVEEFHDPRRSGVDDLGFAEHGQLPGGLAQCRSGAQPHSGDEFDEVRPVFGLLSCLSGHGIKHGEHGPVDGPGHGLPGPGGGEFEGLSHGLGRRHCHPVQGIGDALECDSEDESGVSAGAASCALG